MLTNTVPSTRLYQEFSFIPTELTENLLALVIAHHFYVCRYAVAAEKALGAAGAYTGIEATIPWPNRPTGGVVDSDWVRVFVDDALLEYFHDPLDDASLMQAGSPANRLVASAVTFRTANGVDRSVALLDRDVAVGDVVTATNAAGTTFTTRVTGFEYEETAASLALVGDNGADTNNQAALTEAATITTVGFTGVVVAASAAAYDGLAAGHPEETYTITCTRAMTGVDLGTAQFTVSSASGSDDVAGIITIASGVAEAIGTRGATLTLTVGEGDAIALGDTIAVRYRQNYEVPVFALDGSAVYTGATDRRYVIRVIGVNAAGNPIISARTTTGDDVTSSVVAVLAADTAVGDYGVAVSFTGANAPCPGDKYYVDATAAAPGACNTLVLARSLPAAFVTAEGSSEGSPAPDLDIRLAIKKNLEIPRYSSYPVSNFAPGTTSLVVSGAITLTDSTWTNGDDLPELPLVGGNLYIQYRALMPTFTSGRFEVTDSDEVVARCGPAIPENPLGLAVMAAALNSNGQPVGFIALDSYDPTDEATAFAAALAKVRDDIRCYGVVAATQDASVNALVKAHVLAQSAANRKRFRVAYLNSASETLSLVTNTDEDGATLTAAFHLNAELGTNVDLVSTAGNFVTDGVAAGDIVRYNFGTDGDGVVTFDTAVVDSVESEDILRLVSGPDQATSLEDEIEIWRSRSATAEATAYAGLSSGFNDRRVRHIWPPTAEWSDGTSVPGWALCAALAGQRSGSAPHQPLSNAELNGFASVARTTAMRESDLDIMAESGTWIVTQAASGGAVYNRLAVTTDVTDANHWQDVRTTNADSISFGYDNRLRALVGRYNITERTLQFIASEIYATSNFFKSEARTPELGAQLLDAVIISGPTQNPTQKDTVEVGVRLSLPYELDGLDLYLYVE